MKRVVAHFCMHFSGLRSAVGAQCIRMLQTTPRNVPRSAWIGPGANDPFFTSAYGGSKLAQLFATTFATSCRIFEDGFFCLVNEMVYEVTEAEGLDDPNRP